MADPRETRLPDWATAAGALVVGVGADTEVAHVSTSLASLLGYQRSEIVGRPIEDFVHPDDLSEMAGALLESFAGMNATGDGRARLARALHRDGTTRLLKTTTQAAPDPSDPTILLAVLEDLSRPEHVDLALRGHLDLTGLLIDITRLLKQTDDLGEPGALNPVLAATGLFLNVDRVERWGYTHGVERPPQRLGSWTRTVSASHPPTISAPIAHDVLLADLTHGLAIAGENLDAVGQEQSFLVASGDRGRHVTSFLCVGAPPGRTWTDAERRCLKAIDCVIDGTQVASTTAASLSDSERADPGRRAVGQLVDAAPFGAVLFSVDQVVEQVNPIGAELLGRIEGTRLVDLDIPTDVAEELALTFESGETGAFSWNHDHLRIDCRAVPRFERSEICQVIWYLDPRAKTGSRQPTLDDIALDVSLRVAVDDRTIGLRYQPEFDARTGALTAIEALALAHTPSRILTGEEFVARAEETGIILEIDTLVLQIAIAQAARWRESGWAQALVRINISTATLADPGFPERLSQELARHRLPGEHICLEITETGAIDDPVLTEEATRMLADIGVDFALDDFGTGHSSLARFARFPANVIKLDRTFASQAHRDERSRRVVAAIVDLAHSLHSIVVAEGVESDHQRRVLTDLGCDRLQGYYLSNPKRLDDIDLGALLAQPSPAIWTASS